jgi:hypothetical protein
MAMKNRKCQKNNGEQGTVLLPHTNQQGPLLPQGTITATTTTKTTTTTTITTTTTTTTNTTTTTTVITDPSNKFSKHWYLHVSQHKVCWDFNVLSFTMN